ncbi:MAG: stalk domain-containing protein [Acidobacteriota bacterium]
MRRKARAYRTVIAILLVLVLQLSFSATCLLAATEELNKYEEPRISLETVSSDGAPTMVRISFGAFGKDIIGYVIQRRTKDSNNYYNVAHINQGQYQYMDMPAPGPNYFYRVGVKYVITNYKYADTTKGEVQGEIYIRYSPEKEWSFPPTKPENLKVRNTSRGIEVTWEDKSDNEKNFVLTKGYDSGSGFLYSPIVVKADSTSYLDSSFLQKNKKYNYKIRAHGASSDSGDTSEVSIIYAEVRDAPQQLSVQNENPIYSINTTNIQNQLSQQLQKSAKNIILRIADPKMIVDGLVSEIEPGKGTTPVLIKGQVMVPIKTIIEALGGTIYWDAKNNIMNISLANKSIRIWGNNYEASGIYPIYRNSGKLPIPFQTIKGRTYVPISFIATNLGLKMEWNPKTKTATIKRIAVKK